jgi:hypothetical protein
MPDLYYMKEKYGVAVHLMATSDGTLRQRVRDAYVTSVRIAHTVEGGRPEAQASAALIKRMDDLAEKVTQDGTYDTSFSVMSDERIAEVAEDIYDIHLEIVGELGLLG